MRSEIFLRENLIAIFKGVASAHADLATRLNDHDTLIYSTGFAAALRAVATAVGVEVSADSEPARHPQVRTLGQLRDDEGDCMVIRFGDLRPTDRLR